MKHSAWLFLSAFALSCTVGTAGPMDGDPPDDDGVMVLANCDDTSDSDGDGVADQAEGDGDTDADGTPNILDPDTDGDGIFDGEEHGNHRPCALPDADGDSIPNWLDLDSDNDGLSDRDETSRFATDPNDRDSDD